MYENRITEDGKSFVILTLRCIMGISFGKRKVKIKLLGQTETVKEEEKQKETVQTYRQEIIVSKPKPKVNRTFKEALKEITEQSKKLNLSDFTVYQYYYSDGRYKFSKVTGNSVLSEITLEKYWSTAEPTVFRRATGLSEAQEYRSRLVILCRSDGKDYILVWSSILYEAFDDEVIKQLKALLKEMRDKQ